NILQGAEEDHFGLVWKLEAMIWSGRIGMVLLWVAAILTFVTGLDYFAKARPFLKD
ncbi:MAG: CDP-diacylglycerol--glycerol-3-phosphate 3-phosphatidyltransferase, partial [Rhodobacteraceae bacterium]|nr:CDP-diacylglycerol--glycerol-3-phosphate 3-phosphatidyltransferase [Paracoccaceae bacterium]